MKKPSDDLRSLPVFANLPKKSLSTADSLMTSVSFDAGDVLCAEGKFGLEVFIIVSGTAKVTQGDSTIAEVGSGHVIGEIALLDNSLRSASVTATEPVTALVMTAREFLSVRELPGVDDAIRQIAENHRANRAPSTS
jgi:CRP-like cAMP-binding protein